MLQTISDLFSNKRTKAALAKRFDKLFRAKEYKNMLFALWNTINIQKLGKSLKDLNDIAKLKGLF